MLYELCVFLQVAENLLTVDTVWSKSRPELEYLAGERKTNNPEYLTIIIDYKAISANIV